MILARRHEVEASARSAPERDSVAPSAMHGATHEQARGAGRHLVRTPHARGGEWPESPWYGGDVAFAVRISIHTLDLSVATTTRPPRCVFASPSTAASRRRPGSPDHAVLERGHRLRRRAIDMRHRPSIRRPWPGSIALASAPPTRPPPKDLANPGADRTRWLTGLTGGAVRSVRHHLAATRVRVWGRRSTVQRTRLQIGSGLDAEVADMRGYAGSAAVAMLRSGGLTPGRRGEDHADGVAAGHIVRTRPPTGSLVPMGTTVDYVVASSVGRHRRAPVGDSGFVDHDATARLKREAA